VVMDWLFFGLTASCIFVLRAREKRLPVIDDTETGHRYRVPGHPWTTGLFVVLAWLIVANTIYKHPGNSGIALCILFAGVPVYFLLQKLAHGQTK
jgi:APA family basic amino acid/polyamine antiporter